MADTNQTKGMASGVEALSGSSPYVILGLVVVGVLLLVVGVVLYTRRHPLSRVMPKLSAAAKPSLSTLWERYLRRLDKSSPGARFYPTVVVLGGPKVGKTHLIGRVDWEGQQAQGLPSEPGDARMPRYCGRNVLVEEVSSDVLRDTGDDARQLTEIWSANAAPPPAVLVVLDAKNLVPGDLKALADSLRGKLEVLARLRKGPVPVRLCLSHMDELEGYREIVARLDDRRDTLVLRVVKAESQVDLFDANEVARSFDVLRSALPRVLVAAAAPDLERAVGFFTRTVPDLSRNLTPFLVDLLSPGQATHVPVLEGIYLGGLESADQLGDPFVVDSSFAEAAVVALERRSLLRAAVVVAAAALFTTLLFSFDHSRVRTAQTAVGTLETAIRDGRENDEASERAILDAEQAAAASLRSMQGGDSLWLLRPTFAADKDSTRERFLTAVRDHYLLPALANTGDRRRILYALGLLYAAAPNALGQKLLHPDTPTWDLADWATVVNEPEAPLHDYVELSPSTWNHPVTIPAVSSGAMLTREAWGAYLTELSADFATVKPGSTALPLGPTELAALRKKNEPFLSAVDGTEHYQDMNAVGALLRTVAPRSLQGIDSLVAQTDAPAWVNENHTVLKGLVTLVQSAKIETPPARMNLRDLMIRLAAPAPVLADATYAATLDSQAYSFATKDWTELVARARGAAFIDAFMTANSSEPPSTFSFFTNPGYPAIGRAFVVGKGPKLALQGIFTRAAFNDSVAPTLDAFADKIDKVSLSDSDRGRLKSYLSNETDRYAEGYRDALTAYYASFQFAASSDAVLRAMLSELVLPSSWFTDFLKTVGDNANLPVKEGDDYARVAQRLAGFAPIVTLMTEQKGEYPALQKYLSFLAPLFTPAPAAGGDKPAGLADLLPSMGKASLSMLREEKDSIAVQVDAWLTSSGIGANQSAPFLAPVSRIYRMGIEETAQVLGQQWRQNVVREARPVLKKFPFDPKNTDEEATMAEVEALFSPTKGTFWKSFAAMIQPVCTQRNGTWVALSSSRGAPKLPDDALTTANDLTRMAGMLWDKDGKPQPIPLDVVPQSLQLPDADDAVTLSTMRTGKTAFFGFNQMPTPQHLDFPWWEEGASAVEVQIGRAESTRTRYLRLEVADSPWSFYRLLTKATTPKVTWTLPDAPERDKAVEFEIRGDPWAPFHVRVTP